MDPHAQQCSSTTACAMPGMLCPSLKLTLDSSAPVGRNSTRFHSPRISLGKIYAAKVVAAQPQPDLRHGYPVYLDRRSAFRSLHEDPRAEFRSQTGDL